MLPPSGWIRPFSFSSRKAELEPFTQSLHKVMSAYTWGEGPWTQLRECREVVLTASTDTERSPPELRPRVDTAVGEVPLSSTPAVFTALNEVALKTPPESNPSPIPSSCQLCKPCLSSIIKCVVPQICLVPSRPASGELGCRCLHPVPSTKLNVAGGEGVGNRP